ncbi:MAG: alkaline phosphatase [Gemmatimonadota bacterium]|nr:alkaline phosphatase [Gemmatimonadota bacterium]
MRRNVGVGALLSMLWLIPGPGAAQMTADGDAEVRNVILMIADGAGVATWSVARMARGSELAVAGMPVVGLVDTRNADGGLTDSAAGATAFSTGARTFNRAIAVGPECRDQIEADPAGVAADPASCAPLPTLLEGAEERGKATGMVTTTALTDATPASFAAHAPSRDLHASLAVQVLDSGADVLLGGGRMYFDGSLQGGPGDLLRDVCGEADCPRDAAELEEARSGTRRLLGLFAADEMERAGERVPDLPTMTRAALERLSANPEGLFLLVETEGTDSYQHDNDPLPSIRREILEFDRAVAEALAFAERTPGTLVVVTGDHETGGLAVHGEAETTESEIAYTSGGHTHAMVPLFAHGPGAERLAGIRDNDEVGRILRALLLGDG